MATDLANNIQTARIVGGYRFVRGTNAPNINRGRQYQYYGLETATFIEQQARYASNYFLVQAQGLNPDDWLEYNNVTARISNLISPGVSDTLQQNWKHIYFDEADIDHVVLGAEIIVGFDQYADKYLLTNVENHSSITAGGTMRRENATWCHLDYYGNIIKTGFVWAKNQELATAPNVTDYIALLSGYEHCVMQHIPETECLSENDRIILGNNAYFVRGLDNFTQEFSADMDTNRLFYFDLDRTEPTENDDMVNKVAEGKAFKWTLDIAGMHDMGVGNTQQLNVISTRNGVRVSSSLEYPISYIYTSSDENVLTVTDYGLVTAVGEGNATITVALTQNPDITVTWQVTVLAAAADGIYWGKPPMTALTQTQYCAFDAICYVDGEPVDDPVTFTFAGAAPNCYQATIDGNTVYLTCYKPSDIPLTVTASANGYTLEATIVLLGF